eukprot:TRINITY_DN19726_c0_g1_i1.p1 TRINITY_DN19726_c0_g1~~TRINITY_DN19726_c0_g1_i1.p1  ORF type:complete len:256 (-),score=48.96 TRINITY_DN19726_c0_g1_i1:35-733(-)
MDPKVAKWISEIPDVLQSPERLERARSNSFRDFHTTGFDYINLHRSEELTVKLYIFDQPKTLCGEYLVSPHSHRYNFTTFVLQGWIRNVTFAKSTPSVRHPERNYSKFMYRTPLSSRTTQNEDAGMATPKGAEFIEETALRIASDTKILEGAFYYLDYEQIHTIVVPSKEPAMLLLFQEENQVQDSTELFLKESRLEASPSVYQPYDEKEFRELLEKVWSTMSPKFLSTHAA